MRSKMPLLLTGLLLIVAMLVGVTWTRMGASPKQPAPEIIPTVTVSPTAIPTQETTSDIEKELQGVGVDDDGSQDITDLTSELQGL